MHFRSSGHRTLTIAFLTSILAIVFTFLDAFSIFKAELPVIFFGALLFLVVLFTYSRTPELYSAPEISIPIFFLFTIAFLFEQLIDPYGLAFEAGLLFVTCLAGFYLLVWRKGLNRVFLTTVLLGILITGIYLLQAGSSILLPAGLVLCVMPLVLYSLKYARESLGQRKTPVGILRIGLAILALITFLDAFLLLASNTAIVAEGSLSAVALVVSRVLVAGMILLGSLARYLQPDHKPSQPFRIAWWGVTLAVAVLAFVAHPLLGKWASLYGLDEQLGWLSVPVWALFACALGVQVIFWAHRNLRWQWSAFTIGSTGGLLLSYLWSSLAYAASYILFVPGQTIAAIDLDDALQLGAGAGVVVLLATTFLAVYASQPRSRLRAVSAAAIAGITASLLVFVSSGANLSVIASQRSLYGVAFTRVGFDEVGWLSAFTGAILYIHPWVYGTLAVCLAIGLLPAVLLGFTWPIKRNTAHPAELDEPLSPSVPLHLFSLSGVTLILFAVFSALDWRIANTMAGVGLKPWWKPEWIVPLTIALPAFILLAITGWIFIRMQAWKRSPRTSILVCLTGLILILDGLGIWFIAPEYGLAMFVLLGIGIEIFRQGMRLWDNPEPRPSSNMMPIVDDFGALSGVVPAFLTGSIGLLPLLVIVAGLGTISIEAITELRNVTGDPPGAAWLMQMLEQATQLTPAGSVFGLLVFFGILYFLYGIIDLAGNPTRIGYWWERSRLLRERLEPDIRNSFNNKGRMRLLIISWILVGALLVFFLWDNPSSLIILLFLVSYTYLRLRPHWFRKISWSAYNIAGLVLLAGILLGQVARFVPIALFAGPALALIYRGMVVYSGDSRRTIFRSLFFPALGIFIFLYASYRLPVSVIQNGIARFTDGRWENIGAGNSPLGADKNYSFISDSKNNLWIYGYYGPEALLQNNSWTTIRIIAVQSPTTDKLAASGMMLEQDGNYFFINERSLFGIVQVGTGYLAKTPNRPRPTLTEVQGNQSNTYGENAESCGTPVIDDKHECPSFPGKITSATVDPEGNIWLGTDGSGVARFHHDPSMNIWDWKFLTMQNSGILSDYIIGISAGEDGSIWVLSTTGVSGLSAAGDWTNYSLDDLGFGFGQPQTFLLDSQGRLWVGSPTGISFRDGRVWQKTSLPKPASISGFYEDRTHGIWALTTTGAWRYADQGWTQIIDIPVDPFWRNPLGSSSFYRVQPTGTGIRKMVEDHAGNLWFGGPHGLLRYDAKIGKAEYFYPSNSGLPSENVQDLQLDANGNLWVSTYTPIIAYRTELPIVGFSILVISALLGIIYIGYQHSPQFKAQQIAKRLDKQRRELLPEVYQTFTDTQASEVLEALALQPLPEKGYANLVDAYAVAVGQNQTPGKERARRLLEALQENPGLVWYAQTAGLYQFIVQAIQVRSISDIANVRLAVLRSQAIDRVNLAFNDSTPFELPAFVAHGSANALEMLGKASLLLRKYIQVDSPQDRLGFIADSLGAVEKAEKETASITGAENYFIREICSVWLETIRRELDVLSGHADLRVQFRTKQVRQSEAVTLVLNIRNDGSAIANQVQVSLLPNDRIQLPARATRLLEYIAAGSSETLEFSLTSPAAGDVRVAGEIIWSDRIEKDNRLEFADIIRFYESSERFERIPNPYIVGHPVKSSSLFHGRDDIFEFISQNLHGTTQSRTLVLYGQRRTGKTSILYQLLGGRLGEGYIPVLVDVQELAPGIRGMSDLFLELALHMERALGKSGVKMEKIDEAAFSAAPTRAFSRFLTGIEEQLGGRKIVCMFDEFELLEERIHQGKLEPESLGYLRSLMQHREDLIFIFTGTHKLEQMSKDYWSIFFNIALHQQVSFMNDEAAVHLIREPVRRKLSIDDLVVEKILSLTHGHPYFIQLLCWALVNHCNKKEKNYATLSDLNEVLKDIVSTGEPYFAYIWTQVSGEERMILAALAERLAPGRSAISIQEILETIEKVGVQHLDRSVTLRLLDRLANLEILASSGHGGTLYSYRVGLIGEWVKSSKPLRHLAEREP